MRIFICWLIVLGFLVNVEAQNKFATNNGEIKFASKAQLELIKAASTKLQGVIDPTNE